MSSFQALGILSLMVTGIGGQPDLGGEWQIQPLAVVGMTPAGEAGVFREFGASYPLADSVVFWARYGAPESNEWALFAVTRAEGKSTRIAVEGKDILLSGNRKGKVDRETSMYVAGRRLFMAPDMLWDGSQVRSLMGAGESLTIAGTAYQLKRTEVLDVAADGRALVYWDSDRPPANGWGWHDGTTLQAWLKEGDALPGEKDVTIKNLSTGNGCYTHCVPMPRTGPDGTVAAVLEVAGASYKKALYRIGPVRTVKILDDTERVSGSIRGTNDKLNLGDGKIDLGDVEVRAVSNNAVFFRQVYREKPGFSLVRGPWEVYFLAQPGQIWTSPTEVRERALLGEWYRFDDKGAVFPDGDSDRLLFSVWTLKMGRGFKASLVFFPGLYEWNANGAANAIQWEQAMGADAAMVKETLQRRGTQASTTRGGPSIELSPATAMPGAVRVRLPALGNAPRNWLIVPAAGPAKLERKPALTVKGADVSAADVVAWLSTNEALVELNDGLHVLTRTTR